MTAIAATLTRTERRRLLERLAEREDIRRLMTEPGSLAAPDEPVPLHRRRTEDAPVTTLTVTTAGPQGGLAAPARAVTGIRARRGERSAAAGADPAGLASKPLLDLPSQAPDRRLGIAQLGDHPRLDGYLCLPGEGIEAVDAAGQDDIREPPLRGMPGHVTTITVTPEPVPLHHGPPTAPA